MSAHRPRSVNAVRLAAAEHERFRVVPVGHQMAVHRGLLRSEHVGELVQFLAGPIRTERFDTIDAAAPRARSQFPATASGCTQPPRLAPAAGSSDRAAPEIARVAPEQLVAAVARKADGHMPAREPRHQISRNLRRIREWLVVQHRQLRDHRQRLRGSDIEFRVVGAEMPRDGAWRTRLVEAPPRRKPIVNVFTGRALCACMSATTVDESMPPDRNAPSGTSAIIWRATASRSKRVELPRLASSRCR